MQSQAKGTVGRENSSCKGTKVGTNLDGKTEEWLIRRSQERGKKGERVKENSNKASQDCSLWTILLLGELHTYTHTHTHTMPQSTDDK
jgi:hypothetical protein